VSSVVLQNFMVRQLAERLGEDEAARTCGETAIGYRLEKEAGDSAKSYGVHTNPKKSEKVVFTSEDKVIVIAEN